MATGIANEENIAQIMPPFLTDTKDQLNILIAGIKKGSSDKISSCAHAINGAAATLGATKLSKAAERIEKDFLNGNLSDAKNFART
ncbi:MAG: Hpt domain-containing protein [Planctomycetota bacterium]